MSDKTGKDSGGISGFNVGFGTSGKAAPNEVNERGPLRVVVLSELLPRHDYATGAAVPAHAMPIDKATFDSVMQALAPSLAIEVPDPFTPSAESLRIDLRWRDLKALRPDAIVEQAQVLRVLVDARRIVDRVQARQLSAAEARAQLARLLPRASWAEQLAGEVGDVVRPAAPAKAKGVDGVSAPAVAAPAAKSGSALDDLLSKVDFGAPAAPAEPEPEPQHEEEHADPAQPTSLLAAVIKGARKPVPLTGVVGTAPERVAKAFARILEDILQHPEVRRLERAWRGLRLFIDQCDFRAGVEVDVIPVDAAGVEDALRHLHEHSGVEAERAPVDFFVVDHEVDASAASLDRLARWAELAEAFRAPIVTNGHADLLGADDVASLGKTLRRLSSADDPRATAMRGFASRDTARWVAIALNGPLVRAPYTAQTSRVKDLPFHEDAHDPGARVFAGPAYVLASLGAKSYVKNGWPTAIVGPRDGVLGNLPVWEANEAGNTVALPLETFVTTDAQNEVARAGFVLLASAPNSDAAVVGKAPVVFRGTTAGGREDAPATTTLADTLFTGRLANAIEQLASALPADAYSTAAAEVARVTLLELFANAPPSGPELTVKVDTAKHQLAVTVRPRRFAGVSLEEVTLGAALG